MYNRMNPESAARREANVRRVTQASLSARAKQLSKRRLDDPVFRALNQTGGGSSSGSFGGQGIDGPIAGATVLAVDEGVTTTTDANGFFNFNFVPTGAIELTGGNDTVTGVAFTGTLKAPAGSTIISPITTAIKEMMDLGNTEEEATDAVFDYAREIYEIDIPSSVRERVKTENFLTLAETNNDFLKVVGFTSALEVAAEVASGATGNAATDVLKRHKEAFYRSVASQINTYKTQLKPGSGTDWSTGLNSRDNLKKTSFILSGDNITTISSANAGTIKQALDHTFDRIKEVVNDSNMDPSFGTTAIMTQNRLGKQEIAQNAVNFGKGTVSSTSFRGAAETSVAKEAEEYSNLGTIFSGKDNREEPSAEKQSDLYPEAVDYVTVVDGNKYAQGELTRSLETKINDLPTYSGTINGESTFLWYSRSDKRWVVDNNLEAPFIAPANSRRSYPITGDYTNTSTESAIIITLPGVHEDQPQEPSGTDIDGLIRRNSIVWASADKTGTVNEDTGVTTWNAAGKIYTATIKGDATGFYFSGTFVITLNEGSEQYVITLGEGETVYTNGEDSTAITSFNMGITLAEGEVIYSRKGLSPTFVSGTYS